ncbi:MAG: thermonuclease family protein [Planctomycetota bacterium]
MAAAATVLLGAMIAIDRAGWLGRRPPSDWERYHRRQAEVVYVVDGDTLDVGLADLKRNRPDTRIRLWGVDTPETAKSDTGEQHYGPETSAFAKRMLTGKTVTLRLQRHDTRGNYGRLLAYVILPDGRMFNRILVEKGYAYADPRWEHQYREQFIRLQRQTMRQGKGLWKNVTQAELPSYWNNVLELPRPADAAQPAEAR